jgi:hypothetical protein
VSGFPVFCVFEPPTDSQRVGALAYEIRLGTIEQADADIEWVLRPYQRTARKRNQL